MYLTFSNFPSLSLLTRVWCFNNSYRPYLSLCFKLLHCTRQVSSNDFPAIESLVKNIIKEKQPFERLVLTKAQLLELFKHNPFKQRIIKEKVQTESTTVYRCGPLIDLCRGPHIRWPISPREENERGR